MRKKTLFLIALFIGAFFISFVVAMTRSNRFSWAQQANDWDALLPGAQPSIFTDIVPILPGIAPASPTPSLSPSVIASPLPIVSPSPSVSPTATPPPSPSPEQTQVRVPVLMYHYIRNMFDTNDKLGHQLSVAPAVFDQQMAYLKDHGYTTISPQELYDSIEHHKKLPTKPVLLTFDDGYQDFFSEAKNVVEKYQVKVTLFIPTDLVGRPNYLTWDELKTLAQNPNITIAGHTRHHVHLPQVSPAEAEDEISQGRTMLQQRLGLPIAYFAYPYGGFNDQIVDLVHKAGYLAAFSTISGSSHDPAEIYHLKRITINGQDDIAVFAKRLTE